MVMKKLKYSIFLGCTVIILCFSCQKNNDFPLDPFFNKLEETSPKSVLNEFKNSSMNSVVINHDKFSEIFTDAASIVLQDSSNKRLFENYCEDNSLSLTYKQDYYTIIAAFHKRLHKKTVNIEKLKQEMVELSNEHNELIYTNPR